MSEENVEVVYGLAAAVGRRDLAFFMDVTDPAVEWHASVAVIAEGGAYHGHEGVRQYLSDIEEAFERFDATVEQALTVGQVVVAVGQVSYRGKASGVEQTEPFGWVIRFRKGQVVYLRAFRKPEGVFAAVGVPE